ncbi:hypothetical protein [Halopelagius fulvigenes]|uniref:Uncharacterized protein n=1 Tax=Halopelagius fulvigenes TaxID=1198324 RepID=A0ABD5U0F5_9EURY
MPSGKLTRRRALAACGLGLISPFGGCSQVSPTGTADSSRKLALSLSPFEESLRERYVVDLTETRPSWDEEAFDAALNGSAYTTQHRTPFLARGDDEPTYARRNGTYYRLDSLVVGESEVTHPVLRVYEVEGSSGDAPDAVAHSSLPEADRRAVKIAYFAARARGNVGGVPWGLVERDGYVYRDEVAISSSRILSDSGPSRVEYRETVYEVEVTRETFHEAVYRANVEPVADSESEMETILRARLLDARIAREDLSPGARKVVRDAIREAHSESHPYSPAFESVLKKLDRWTYLDGNVEKDGGVESGRRRGYLRYDERYFGYRLQFVSEA